MVNSGKQAKKRPSLEGSQLVEFLEELDRKLTVATQKAEEIKEPELFVKHPTDQSFIHMVPAKGQSRKRSKELVKLLDSYDGFVVVHPKSKDNEPVKPRRSNSLQSVKKSNSLPKLNDGELEVLNEIMGPRRSKSLTKALKSKNLDKTRPKKSSSLTKLQPRKSKSLNKVGYSPVTRRVSYTRSVSRSNWFYRNFYIILAVLIMVGIVLWGIYAILQDEMRREKCRQGRIQFC